MIRSLPNRCRTTMLLAMGLLLFAPSVFAKPYASVKYSLTRAENPKDEKSLLALPYAFAVESLGLAYGIGAMSKGYGQEQLVIGGTVLGSSDDAAISVFGAWDLRLPWTERFFLTAVGSTGWYPRQRAYSFPFYPAGTIRPGSNDSRDTQFMESGGTDNWLDFELEYVLPIGAAGDRGMMAYRLENGLLTDGASGGPTWNPLDYGVTNLLLRQYNRYQSYEPTDLDKIDGTIHPLTLGLYHNNTDFPGNPSSGSSQYLALTRSFGWLDSEWYYTFWELEASKYLSFGESRHARQRVLALNGWLVDTPTWEEHLDGDGNITISGRAPFLDGARLGGFYRMRGYANNRFHGRSALYTTAEYRYTLHWNPLARIKWLRFVQSDWLQLAGFVESGRVSDRFVFRELLADWKIDGGVGLRGLFAGVVARLDLAISNEGLNAWAMIGHPF